MNKKQPLSMWLSVGVIVGILLFPPWHVKNISADRYENEGYWLIFLPPYVIASIDYSRLILPIGAFVIIALSLIVTFRDKKPK
jgi:hypothetical protein